MTTPIADLSIDALLSEERALVRAILGLLQSERESLTGTDADRLGELAARKSALFGQLTDIARRRQVALSTLGFAADRGGMEAWITCQARASLLRDEWHGLHDDLEAASDINRLNGKLIEEYARANRQALGVLMHAGNAGGVYGPDGRAFGPAAGRRLGSA